VKVFLLLLFIFLAIAPSSAQEGTEIGEEAISAVVQLICRSAPAQEGPVALPSPALQGEGPSGLETYKEPTTGMEFVLVKGGSYQMGDTLGDGNPNERPIHEVCVDDFYLGQFEVTVGQFRQFVNATGYRTEAERGDGALHVNDQGELKKEAHINWKNPGCSQTDRHPVVCVSWNDAHAFLDWLSQKSGKAFRLPTEAEWEYAARSGGKSYKYSWGNGDPSGNIADESAKRKFPWASIWWQGYDDGYAYTAPVGSFSPNELGLFDMTGNVWEWCQDWYGKDYYASSPKNNPTGPDSGTLRIGRGGSWYSVPRNIRATYRFRGWPSERLDGNGFRVALPLQQ
jgi:formylglycine-generating enzyme required for sulfatase activity